MKSSIYIWQGVNKYGERCHGEHIGTDNEMVKNFLLKQEILPIRISKKITLFSRGNRVNFKDITLFARQMVTLLTAGISIVKALDIIAHTQTKITFTQLILKLKTDITAGCSMTEALRQHPKYFNKIFCNLIAAGEKSGKLEQIFERIAQHREKHTLLKIKINKALFYPATILTVAILICSGLLIFVVPQFATLFQSFGAELPLMTRIVVQLGNGMQHYGWILLFNFAILLAIIKVIKQRSSRITHFFDRWQLKLPIIGNILQKAIIASFSRTLAILFASGISLIESLHTVANTTGNSLYLKAAHQISEAVSNGQTLKMAIQQTHLFPSLVAQMINVGEESGTLENMLLKIAAIYEDEVNNSVDSLTTLLEPFIMVILGILVGSLVIAMYLPIFKLGSIIH